MFRYLTAKFVSDSIVLNSKFILIGFASGLGMLACLYWALGGPHLAGIVGTWLLGLAMSWVAGWGVSRRPKSRYTRSRRFLYSQESSGTV